MRPFPKLPHTLPTPAARVGLPALALLLPLALAACGGGGNTTIATTPATSSDQSCAAANTHCAPQP